MVLAVSLVLVPAVGTAAGPPEDEVIATLDGKPITLSEIEENAAFQIYRLRGSIYSLLQKEALEIADRRLLAKEAARQGLSVEALLEKVVDGKAAPLSEKDVDAYLAEHPEQAVKDPEGRARLKAYLEERARIQRRLDYLASLREKADYRFLAQQPERPRIRVDTEGAPWRGEAQAPVTLVHFAHFSSRLCAEKRAEDPAHHGGVPRGGSAGCTGTSSASRTPMPSTRSSGAGGLRAGKVLGVSQPAHGAEGAGITGSNQRVGRCDQDRHEEIRAGAEGGDVSSAGQGRHRPRGADRRTGHPAIFVNGIYFSGTFAFEELRALVQKEMERVKRDDEAKERGDIR